MAQWQPVEIGSRLYTTDAGLYDIAFSWDVSAEVDWLLAGRLGRDWAAAIAETSFTYAAVYESDRPERPRRSLGDAGRHLWHELRARV